MALRAALLLALTCAACATRDPDALPERLASADPAVRAVCADGRHGWIEDADWDALTRGFDLASDWSSRTAATGPVPAPPRNGASSRATSPACAGVQWREFLVV